MKTAISTLKMLSIAFVLGAISCSFTACSKDDGGDKVKPELEVETIEDLDGSGAPVFFSFSSGTAVAETSTSWDIKFDGTTLSFGNGAEAILTEGLFNNYVTAPTNGYAADNIAGSGSWYNYTAMTEPQHAILPIPGKIIVIKTHDDKYVKLEMLSYYEGNPDTTSDAFKDPEGRPTAKVYTFRYAIQLDGSTNLK
ncbi:MAG TPA: HmuY family protein [Parapedobacter sp.]|uniref:HmuY family protein n=1 Tax=Parapedobacter sp. TaxID=1958893 RepID=UPI002C7F81A6|nr:HmuY family protein [Parapedobacter sp.]HWK58438.1 HmuY family protein [Parapedobacter sp.]